MPPEVAQELAAAGLRNYTMFRHEDTVVGYAEDVGDMTGALAALARSDAYTRWAQQFDGVFASGEDCDTVGSDVRICGEVWHLRHE
jgi:L-rhamnose mutarotase